MMYTLGTSTPFRLCAGTCSGLEALETAAKRSALTRTSGPRNPVLCTPLGKLQHCALLNCPNFRFRCGSVAVQVKWISVNISSCFAISKIIIVVHSLEPGATPITRRLTRLQTMCTVFKYRKIFQTVRCGCGSVAVIFSIYLCLVL